MKGVVFTKEKSLIIKGMAILMMLWHHCFLPGRYDGYSIDFWPLVEYQVTNVASFCKICVSLFVFVSGYGLYMSYTQEGLKDNFSWIKKLVRTLSGFWFVVILSWIICGAIDQRPINVYEFKESTIYGVWNMFVEIMGMTNLFGKTPMNATWWYMSAAIVFIILTPLLFSILKKLGGVCVMGMIFILPRALGGYPGNIHFLSFMPAFCLGMIFANYSLFEKWKNYFEKKNCSYISFLKFAVMSLFLICTYKIYHYLPDKYFWDIKWGIIPLVWIGFINDYVSTSSIIGIVLHFLGKHSMNIFLIHTFFRYYYGEKLIYNMKHFIVVMTTLLLISIIGSMVIERLKRIIRYEYLIDRIFSEREILEK